MITQEENDLLTRVDPGTPAGALLRRYWQPVALSQELPEGGAPVPVRLLGEDLVLFRDDQERLGLLGLHCAHRGADLSYGRLEDGGLRCIYHGWLYNIHGRCLEQPGEPGGGEHRDQIRQPAYPCEERGGVIFAYLGPGEPPLLPGLDIGQSVQVETWHADGTARVVYRGTHWDGVLATPTTARRNTMYIVDTRGSTLVLGSEQP